MVAMDEQPTKKTVKKKKNRNSIKRKESISEQKGYSNMQRTSIDMLNLKNERQSDNYMPELSNTVTKPALNGMQLEEAFNIFQERRDRLNTDVR